MLSNYNIVSMSLSTVDVPDAFLQIMQGLCTAVSMLALFPLGELFFFHMLLIKKVSVVMVYTICYR